MGLMMRAVRAWGRSSDRLIACAFGVCWILLTVAGQPCARADEFSWPYNTLPAQDIDGNWPEYVIESDQDVYQPGEQVQVVHRVTNGLSTPYTFWLRRRRGLTCGSSTHEETRSGRVTSSSFSICRFSYCHRASPCSMITRGT